MRTRYHQLLWGISEDTYFIPCICVVVMTRPETPVYEATGRWNVPLLSASR